IDAFTRNLPTDTLAAGLDLILKESEGALSEPPFQKASEPPNRRSSIASASVINAMSKGRASGFTLRTFTAKHGIPKEASSVALGGLRLKCFFTSSGIVTSRVFIEILSSCYGAYESNR